MKALHNSRHAAAFLLALISLVGVPLAIGHALRPGTGAGIGAGVGVLVLGAYLARRTWNRRRSEAWSKSGAQHGFRPVFVRETSPIPLPGFEDVGHLLQATVEDARMMIGDRLERYLVYNEEPSAPRPARDISDPIPGETFVALWIPELTQDWFCWGKRRALLEAKPRRRPAGAVGEALVAWTHRHPQWRLEGLGDLLVASRPNRLASPETLRDYVARGRELLGAIRPTTDPEPK